MAAIHLVSPTNRLSVTVLHGGPDREAPVSEQSAQTIANALREAGHDVALASIHPDDLSAIDRLADAAPVAKTVVFPALHGPWGEGGPLQQLLEARDLAYVGCRPDAAALCMDKHQTKACLLERGLPTPPWQQLRQGDQPTLELPIVLKAVCEGSSFGVHICHEPDQVRPSLDDLLASYPTVLAERFVAGRETTVGVIIDQPSPQAQLMPLPMIEIKPATASYDFQAKYERDDTRYEFEFDFPKPVIDRMAQLAIETCEWLGVRHLARVDFRVDESQTPWILEVNTMPGFTSHSLLPKAAAHHGLSLPALCDRLASAAYHGHQAAQQ